MASPEIERLVDDLIAKGRIPRDLRSQYIQDMEGGLKDHLLRASDYTRKTQELADQRRQHQAWIEQERQKLQNERSRLDEWQSQAQSQLGRLPELTAKVARYEQALKDYQIYDEVKEPEVPAQPVNPYRSFTQQQQHDQTLPPYLKREEAAGALRDFAVLTGKVARLQAMHMKLFGEPLEDDLITHYMSTGEDPEQHWRVKYAVENRQAEMRAQAEAAKEVQMREQIRTELMTQMALDPSRVVGAPMGQTGGIAPVFEKFMQSRAAAYSGETPNPDQPKFVPPEQKPMIGAARERISKATRLYGENFDQVGNPTTEKGRQLFNKYSSA